MIIRITDMCRMGCSHCMIEGSGEFGDHMPDRIYEPALELAQASMSPVVLLSGGEPTEHPDFFRYLRQMRESVLLPVITSNGMFTQRPGVAEQLAELGVFVQVTNDPRYYPQRLEPELFDHEGWHYEDTIPMIFPCRRTRLNGIEATRMYPGCVNLRAAVRRFGLQPALVQLSAAGKQCAPSINVDGSIRAGEADTCHRIGQVGDSLASIEHELATMKCDICGLRDNLKPEHLAAIGEG
jgi:Radical SAM superfamily